MPNKIKSMSLFKYKSGEINTDIDNLNCFEKCQLCYLKIDYCDCKQRWLGGYWCICSGYTFNWLGNIKLFTLEGIDNVVCSACEPGARPPAVQHFHCTGQL